jgi:ATP-dependent DNA helicase RecG
MTNEEVEILLQKGEGTRIEFKECNGIITSSFYETVASFSNKEGGTILLGVTDDKKIKGIPKDKINSVIKNIITSLL